MFTKFIRPLLALFVLLSTFAASADLVVLKTGKVITGSVLQQDAGGVLVQMEYGTFRYPSSLVKDVQKTQVEATGAASITQRMPSWAVVISALATNSWAHEMQQIPATVIDNGVLENIPYISFRCNTGGYEINIYGDLDKPAGVEIGAINYLAKSDDAKSNCVNFIASILPDPADKQVVTALNVATKDIQKRDGLTFEITLTNEPDAYNGWWVSVYDESALAQARASGSEMLTITQPRIAPKPMQPVVTAPYSMAWTPNELSYARPNISPPSGAVGRVYVRGYYRKDGTYVHSYTRSYPHRHH
jgi:hypothetical protein